MDTLYHRKVFVEDGLVAVDTSHHKGYTCTGTTRIIHRYLPREISELLVYYLRLILPFVQKTTLLTSQQTCFWYPYPSNLGCARTLACLLVRSSYMRRV